MADINLGVGGANSATGGYEIDNSIKLEPNNNEWLYNASPTAGNRQTYTISFWIKRSGLGSVNASGQQYVIGQGQHGRMFFTNDYFSYRFDDGHDCRNITRVFRDPSAWYHFVVAVDTTHASPSSDRVKFYVNGETLAIDDHDGGSYPDQNDQGEFLSTDYLTIGTAPFGGSYNAGDGDYDMRGYLSEFCVVDGQQLLPTDFGEYDDDSGIWKPKDVSGINFGNQGYYLKFDDTSSAGKDSSGNSNNFSDSNLSAADHATDTPTNNFCTFNPLYVYSNQATLTEGGTSVGYPGAAWRGAKGSIGVINGKWYWEIGTSGGWNANLFGIQSTNVSSDLSSGNAMNHNNSIYIGYGSGNYYYYTGGSQTSNESTGWNSGGDWGASDIFGFALDLDSATKKFILYRNGSAVNGSGTNLPSAFQDEYLSPFAAGYDAYEQYWNFGGYTEISISSAASDANGYGTFEYAPPSGYYALCTQNLAEYG